MRKLLLLAAAALACAAAARAQNAARAAEPVKKGKKTAADRGSAMQDGIPMGYLENLKKKARDAQADAPPVEALPAPPAHRLKAVPEPEQTGYPIEVTRQPPAGMEGPTLDGARVVAPPPKKPKKAPAPAKKPEKPGH